MSSSASFRSEASATVVPRERDPAAAVLGICIEAIARHCDRLPVRRRIYTHIIDRCREADRAGPLGDACQTDPLYDVLLAAGPFVRHALDANVARIADDDDHGSGDRPYRVAAQTIDPDPAGDG